MGYTEKALEGCTGGVHDCCSATRDALLLEIRLKNEEERGVI